MSIIKTDIILPYIQGRFTNPNWNNMEQHNQFPTEGCYGAGETDPGSSGVELPTVVPTVVPTTAKFATQIDLRIAWEHWNINNMTHSRIRHLGTSWEVPTCGRF